MVSHYVSFCSIRYFENFLVASPKDDECFGSYNIVHLGWSCWQSCILSFSRMVALAINKHFDILIIYDFRCIFVILSPFFLGLFFFYRIDIFSILNVC